MQRDALIPFLFDGLDARGAIVSLDSGVDEMFVHREYPEPVLNLVRQAAAAMPLLATHLKHPGRINLQFQGGDHLNLLVAQVDQGLHVRAMAKSGEGIPAQYGELVRGARMALMLEPADGKQQYQALVECGGSDLASDLEGYFRQSEQLATHLLLATSRERLVGVMLQRLPRPAGAGEDDDWQRLSALFASLPAEELLAESSETVLHRLFHAEPLRVFESRGVTLACQCSHAGISELLVSMGREELDPVLESEGRVEVTCEFCGRAYEYLPGEVEALIAGAEETGSDGHITH